MFPSWGLTCPYPRHVRRLFSFSQSLGYVIGYVREPWWVEVCATSKISCSDLFWTRSSGTSGTRPIILMKRWLTILVHLFTNKRYGNDWKADPSQSLGLGVDEIPPPRKPASFKSRFRTQEEGTPYTTTCENQTRISMINAATVQRHQAIPALLLGKSHYLAGMDK